MDDRDLIAAAHDWPWKDAIDEAMGLDLADALERHLNPESPDKGDQSGQKVSAMTNPNGESNG